MVGTIRRSGGEVALAVEVGTTRAVGTDLAPEIDAPDVAVNLAIDADAPEAEAVVGTKGLSPDKNKL